MADLKLANSNSPEILPDVVERDCYLSVCLAGLPEKTLMVSLSVGRRYVLCHLSSDSVERSCKKLCSHKKKLQSDLQFEICEFL